MNHINQPSAQSVIFTLFDFDSGQALGPLQQISFDCFTSSPVEIYCRLRDYLSYAKGMVFESAQTATFYQEMFNDDSFGGQCYLAEGEWQGKKFGVLFNKAE